MKISLQQTLHGPRLVTDHKYSRPKLESRVNLHAGTAHIYIYDDIGPWFMGMYGAETFLEDMRTAGENSHIRVHINSPGGDVFEGMSIFSLIRSSEPSRFSAQIDGLAASMASLIPLATSQVDISRAARMMIHEPWTVAAGNASELMAQAMVLEEVSLQAAGIYADRTGQKLSQIQDWMKTDTYFGPDKAVENGFAHRIMPEGDDITGEAQEPSESDRQESQLRARHRACLSRVKIAELTPS